MAPHFPHIALQTTQLAQQRRFYVETLGFTLASEDCQSFAVHAGSTVLEFRAASLPPLYHFAFNIPENKIQEALAWAQARMDVEQRSDGQFIYDFQNWNAHAFYFLDADGNILEFIARHTQQNASPQGFGADQIECISELGLATEDVPKTCQLLIDKLGWRCYPDPMSQPGDEFQAMGAEGGMFIVAKRNRAWLGSERTAGAFPAEVRLPNNFGTFDIADTLCRVVS